MLGLFIYRRNFNSRNAVKFTPWLLSTNTNMIILMKDDMILQSCFYDWVDMISNHHQ